LHIPWQDQRQTPCYATDFLDNCDEAALIRQGGRDQLAGKLYRPDLTQLSAIEQAANLKGWQFDDGWEQLGF
jgi:hypothetical protein